MALVRRLSAKLVPTFVDRWCCFISTTDPHYRIFDFSRTEPLLFFQVAPQLYHVALWTPSQTHYFSENLVIPGIGPGHLDL
jgi:hypothetical protein